jgi:hypothetical protein
LVAAGLALVVASLCWGVLADSLNRWNRAQGLLAADAAARRIGDLLERDLHGALLRDDGGVWLAATVRPTGGPAGSWVDGAKPIAASLNPAAESLGDARFGVGGVWLRLFTASPDPDAAGDRDAAPVAVSYQLIRRGSSPLARSLSYALYRSQTEPRAAFDAGYDLSGPNYTAPSAGRGTPGSLVTPGYAEAVAENVIDFGIRFYREETSPLTGQVTLATIFPRDNATLDFVIQPGSAGITMEPQAPMVADIFVRIISTEGARQLEALEAGRIPGDWWRIAEAHSWVFTRRVLLRSVPLEA